MRPLRQSREVRGFTLIELLVVLAIIGVLVALLLPAVQAAREAARRVQCINNLKQIGIAIHSHQARREVMPPGFSLSNPWNDEITPGFGWAFFLLPDLEQTALYNAANLSLFLTHESQQTVIATSLSTFLCPSEGDLGPISAGANAPVIMGGERMAVGQYVASAGYLDLRAWYAPSSGGKRPDIRSVAIGSGAFYLDSKISTRDILDGSSQTFMIGERSRAVSDATWVGVPALGGDLCTKAGWPTQTCLSSMFLALSRTGPAPDIFGGDIPPAGTINTRGGGPDGFSSRHPGGSNFVLCDGSVRFVKESISHQVFVSLGSRAGGELTDASSY
jgi:prepilin-type N-terminal cleavage/methylation domain-containing protein/prepilin-type processing-associated H-X9-DG protein